MAQLEACGRLLEQTIDNIDNSHTKAVETKFAELKLTFDLLLVIWLDAN
jgi:hypothetical protein